LITCDEAILPGNRVVVVMTQGSHAKVKDIECREWLGLDRHYRKIEDAPISIITIKTARSMKHQAEPEM